MSVRKGSMHRQTREHTVAEKGAYMQRQACKGAHRAMEAREHAEANNGRTPRHTRGHA